MKELYKAYLLGQFRLERQSGREWQKVTHPLWQHRHVRTLLGYLLSSPGRRRGREQLMEELWPELDFNNAANRLNSTVHQLRQLLEPELPRPANSRLLRLDSDVLSLAGASHVWSDIDTFERLSARAQSTSDSVQTEQVLEEAIALYGGDFLQEERHSEWAYARRDALQRKWIGLLLDLADRRFARGALAGAMDALNSLLSADPANEAAVRRLMILLTRLNRRGEALQVYHRLATALQAIYGVAPLPETRDLFEAIRQGNFSESMAGGTKPGLAPPPVRLQRNLRFPAQIGRSNQSTLVGREEELTIMRNAMLAIESCIDGVSPATSPASIPSENGTNPHFLLFGGEAGIGKTRLAEELSREASKRGWIVTWNRAYEQERDIPYCLWTEILRKVLATLDSVRYTQLINTTKNFPLNGKFSENDMYYLSTLLPELHEMLPPGTALPSLLSARDQLHLWEATRNFLAAISYNSPLLIVLDDLQWVDDSSLELLAYLIRQLHTLATLPILLSGTCRETELESTHPLRSLITDLRKEQAIITMNVQPLSPSQIGALVAHLPETMVQDIQLQAAGNPFFAEELARYSYAELSIPDSLKSQQPASQRIPSNLSRLPETITAALDRRMSNLSSACQRLLGKAAVLGGSFEFNLLRFMESNSTTGQDEDSILDLLDEALQAGVLTEESAALRIVYHFWHPLMVSHLYEKLSVARRTQLHRRAAGGLQQLYQGREEEVAAAITHHLLKGGAEPWEVGRFAEMAGDRAYALSAYPEAQHYYQLAIAQEEEAKQRQAGSHTVENTSTLTEERMHLALLQERLGECMMVQGNYNEAYALYEQVLVARGKQTFASQAELQREAQIQALLWYEMGRANGYTSNYEGVQQCNERGEQVLRDAGVTSGVAWACLRLQYSSNCYDEGEYDRARSAAQEALKLYEEALQQKKEEQTKRSASPSTRITQILEGDHSELGKIYEILGIIAATTGQIPGALAYLNKALAIFEQQNNVRAMANVCNNVGSVLLMKAEYQPAKTYYRRSMSLAERVGDFPLQSTVAVNLGELASLAGNLLEAEAWYERSMKLAERVNIRSDMCYVNNILAANLQDQGNLSGAIKAVRRALALGREIKNPPMIGTALITLINVRITIVEEMQAKMNLHTSDPFISHRLRRSHATLRHALALSGLRAEDMAKARLAQAHLYLLQNDLQAAREIATQTMKVVQQQQHFQFLTYAQRLLGCILSASGQFTEADKFFRQAIQTSQKYAMRLEYARALYSFGVALLQRNSPEELAFQEGLNYLHEAQNTLADCHAAIELEKVKRALSDHC